MEESLSVRQKIAHLYRRAGFGLRPDELDRLTRRGLEAVMDDLLHFEKFPDVVPSVSIRQREDPLFHVGVGQVGEQTMTNLPVLDPRQLRSLTPEERKRMRQEEQAHLQAQRVVWINRMIQTKRPLQEKLALFWHGHFATSFRKVRDATLMEEQINLFRRFGIGSFENLVQEVSKDPAMIRWLDTQSNHKQHPNENYARELMELFTLGIGHYTETDVREAARAFTGWKTERGTFRFRKRAHDFGAKTVLGQTGDWNGEEIVRIVTRHPACATFMAGKLFAFLGYENPEPEVVAPLAKRFRDSGYEVRELLRAIFSSPAFWSRKAYRAKVKSPVDLVVSAVRLLGGTVTDRNTLNLMHRMGQILYEPPSVKGWAGGPAWLNTSSLFDRFNFATYLVRVRRGPLEGGEKLWEEAKAHGAGSVEDLVDYYSRALLQDSLSPKSREAILAYVKRNAQGKKNQAREAARMILSSPEFQMA